MIHDPFETAVSAARPELFARGVYALLAADLWIAMIPHAGRYGLDGFNVAHFAWLDRVLPCIEASGYVALLTASGVFAACSAFGPRLPALRGLLALTYTLAWASSMHDSYQHHYLLSWILLSAALLRRGDSDGVPAPALVRQPAYVLALITCAIVYTFTALSKLAPSWRTGELLRRISESRPPGSVPRGSFDALRDAALSFGLAESVFWRALALTAVAVQLTIAFGYLAAIWGDRAHSSWQRALAHGAAFCALLFHGGAELTGRFAIGWFSVYMLWLAFVALTPMRLLVRTTRLLELGVSRVASCSPRSAWTRGVMLCLPLGGGLFVAHQSHVPGLVVGLLCGVSGVGLLAATRGAVRQSSASCALAIALFAAIFAALPVAFDYHRRLAGELLALGRDVEALAVYREAERVAPWGHSRQARIRAITRSLRARQSEPPAPIH